EMYDLLEVTMPRLPREKPTHLLGIGDLESLKRCIALGVDTCDSSYPTKAARHGTLLTNSGTLRIGKSSYAKLFEPIDKECSCYCCKNFSLSYLHHLFKAKELTFMSLASIHNLHFMVQHMENYRTKILNDDI
ncbi:MAG: tRNA-guanine transglycosylase, partial [Simkaniaceae bacterium]|nr:tRNA-guanine transglycosylase [Simkaniaceae bacterium]